MNRIQLLALIALTFLSAATPAQQAADQQLVYELLDRLSQLEREVRQLRGDQEVLQYRLEESERRAQQRYQDLSTRAPSSGGAPSQTTVAPTGGVAAVPPAAAARSTAPAAAPAASSSDPAGEKTAYEAAFAKLREGAFEEAIVGFQDFLVRYPQGEYADNSRYWLGEAYYVNRDFPAAQQAFEAVIADYPNSNKLPDAKLKLGFTLDELNRKSEARTMLQRVIAEYPDTSVARLAERRLQQM